MQTVTSYWKDYKILDAGDRQKLECWKDVILLRPDPQAIWKPETPYNNAEYDGIYTRSSSGGGSWHFNRRLPEFWTVSYNKMQFRVSPTNFKHTGLFPEQAANWDWAAGLIAGCDHPVRVLNLFGYTGAATISASMAGAEEVVHVDAAKGMVNWAKENMQLNGLEDHRIRFIVDDALKFVKREQRRGNHYHLIIMDPPSYGRGPNNELWKLEDKLEELIDETVRLLDDDACGYLVNCYTTGFSAVALENLMKKYLLDRFPEGNVSTVQLTLPISNSKMLLPCGISGRFQR